MLNPRLWPALALVFNAFTWGVSWWPFRQLQAQGLHALWVTTLVFTIAVLGLLLARPRAAGEVLRTPTLWVLLLASGTTNACFNWAVAIGDVVRVVLLFYLMPLWAVLLARGLLGERITGAALARVALALAGAAVVLWPESRAGQGGGSPGMAGLGLADGLAVAGGFAFALNNVMLKREAHRHEAARALAMFTGGALISAALAGWQTLGGAIPAPPALAFGWLLATALLAVWFIASNLALQYGAARLPAQVTSVIMISEVLFASVSAAALGAGTLTLHTLLGGALIVSASLLAAWQRQAGQG